MRWQLSMRLPCREPTTESHHSRRLLDLLWWRPRRTVWLATAMAAQIWTTSLSICAVIGAGSIQQETTSWTRSPLLDLWLFTVGVSIEDFFVEFTNQLIYDKIRVEIRRRP